ncbi:homogentisate solanesyltransferase [Ranunculus cassubicifolius]
MDIPVTDMGVDQKFESSKDGAPSFHCNLSDSEVVHKIAQILLPGLATACVDNTSGDLFKSPASVAVDIRKEMVDYLTQRSETFVAESLVEEGSPYVPTSDHPIDILSDFVDDFASSKQNLFSRISGWLLSEKREDNIDDFVQEMEKSDFWQMERRLSITRTLLKNIDFKSNFHCKMNFTTAEELAKHTDTCRFRLMNCTHEGCRASFCAMHMENHDSTCPHKILLCEQKCSENITRRDMDRHCITVCPMKLVNCPFYHVGCHSSIPSCTIEQHCSEVVQSHLLCILKVVHKEAPEESLNYRAEQLLKLSSAEQLSGAKDVRSLTKIVKDLDAKIGPLEPFLPTAEATEGTGGVPTVVAEEA